MSWLSLVQRKWTGCAADSAVKPPWYDRNGGFVTLRAFALPSSISIVRQSDGPIAPNDEQDSGRKTGNSRHISVSALGIPIRNLCRFPKPPSRRSRWRPSHFFKGPDGLRRLTPHPRFIAARAIKQGRVKFGEAQETFGDGAGLRPWCERG